MIKTDKIQHLSTVWIQVNLITSNTSKSKQTFSYSLNNMKSLFQRVSLYCRLQNSHSISVAHALHQKFKTDFG